MLVTHAMSLAEKLPRRLHVSHRSPWRRTSDAVVGDMLAWADGPRGSAQALAQESSPEDKSPEAPTRAPRPTWPLRPTWPPRPTWPLRPTWPWTVVALETDVLPGDRRGLEIRRGPETDVAFETDEASETDQASEDTETDEAPETDEASDEVRPRKRWRVRTGADHRGHPVEGNRRTARPCSSRSMEEGSRLPRAVQQDIKSITARASSETFREGGAPDGSA